VDEALELLEDERWPEACDRLEALVARYPHQVEVLRALNAVYFELQDTVGLERTCERLLKLTPDDPAVMLGLAGAYLTNVRPFLALRTFRRFVERWPKHEEAAKARATIAEVEADAAELLGELGLAGDEGVELAELHEAAQSLLEQGDYREARRVAEALLRRRPDFVPTLNNLSQLEALEGRRDEAIALSRRALSLDADNVHALANLARYLCLSGHLDEARELAGRLKRVESEHLDAWTKKAEALSYLGDDQGVLEAFRGAERAGALEELEGGWLHHLAAVAALRLGRADEARRRWREAVRAAPDLEVAQANLDDLDKPVAERHAPWPFAIGQWLAARTLEDLGLQVQRLGRRGGDTALARAVQGFLQAHPEVARLIPLLLDRGDPMGREFALAIALTADSPELREALREFALGQRGPDGMRYQAANAASRAGLLPRGLVRMWLQGEWREVRLMGIEIHEEPLARHRPRVERLSGEAVEALHAGDAERAERLLKQAMEVEPDAPDLLNNQAMVYTMQGRAEEAEALVRAVHERHPEYLFACVGLARLEVARGQLDAAKALLEPLLSRQRLHVAELGALCAAQIEVLLAEHRRDAARSWLELWAQVDPENPAVEVYRQQLGGGRQRRLFGRRD
jgi:tetratricopeptide (TPR) repeat protein